MSEATMRQGFGRVSDQVTTLPEHFPHKRNWWILFIVSVSLLMMLVVAATMLFARGVGIWGLNIPVTWGMAIVNYVWWLGIGHAGTLISALLLLTAQHWRNSLNRFAEAMTLFAVTCAGLFPILHLGRPWLFFWVFPYPSTMGVWPQFRSPLAWDFFAVTTYLLVSIMFWYIGMVPDLAAARDRAPTRPWQVFYGLLALGWRGSASHWARWRQSYRLTAAIALPLVVSVHSEVSLLFGVSLLPGWHTTVFPPYFVLGAAFSGFAVVAMIAIVLRNALYLRNLVTLRHLDQLGRAVLATGLMTAYGYLAEIFFGFYNGGDELRMLLERMGSQYAWSYWGAIVFNFLPIQALWSGKVRRHPLWLFLISLSVAIGMWCERFMLIASSLSKDFLVSSWDIYIPTAWDWMTYAGTIGLFMTALLLFVRFMPVIAAFEINEVTAEEKETGHG
jgi:molybdopterin-containing oxidoreductase family membrane subunit